MTRVLVVDDQILIRQAVADILSGTDDITVVGQAANGAQAVQQSREHLPDVVVMDIRMPVMDGIEATSVLCADDTLTETRVLILTTFEEDEYLVSALRAGASGFIGKGSEPDDIVRAVRAVHAGDTLLSPAATRSLITRYINVPDRPVLSQMPELADLTDREREVLQLVAKGLSNQDIADELTISPHTAKTHVNRIMAKLYAHDRAQLVIIAYESGLLTPGA